MRAWSPCNHPGPSGVRSGQIFVTPVWALALGVVCVAAGCRQDPGAGPGPGSGNAAATRPKPAGSQPASAPSSAPASGEADDGDQPPASPPSFLSSGDKLRLRRGTAAKEACPRPTGEVQGEITRDVRWCGEVQVVGHVRVTPKATLTVAPGTTIRFRPYRGHWGPELRLRLRVEGRLVAVGKPGALIRFSSAHEAPINGDWQTVELVGANGSRISYAVFEYGERGLRLDRTQAKLDHMVARFNNREGVAVRNGSEVAITNSRIYGNGYNCVDVKLNNEVRIQRSYLANCGVVGLHVSRSTAVLEQNLFDGHSEAVYLGGGARVIMQANRFNAPRGCALSCDGKNTLRMGNNVFDGTREKLAVCCKGTAVERLKTQIKAPSGLLTGIHEGLTSYIDYIPGRRGHDTYAYLLPRRHATRQVLTRLGEGLGLTWSVAWDGKHLLLANLENQVMRVDPGSGEVVGRFKGPGTQPRGMTVFKERLWINDYRDRKIYAVDPQDGKLQGEFASPDPGDGCRGLTHDGENLFVLGWATPRVYCVSPAGKVLESFPAPHRDLGAGIKLFVRGGLAWDGEAFWGPADRLLRFDRNGQVLGWIHGPAARSWGMTWDGKALWITVRTRESWTDSPRVFRVKPLRLMPP